VIDQFGQVIDVLVAGKQDVAATDRFVIHVLAYGACPAEVSTDRTPVLDELLPVACHM
jgi:transposase-like protein